jgi:16S rRNA (cytosine1407-C5)-methyltransferase
LLAFDEYYKKIYGGRWQSLRESLLLPALSVPYSEGLKEPYFLDNSSVLAALSLRLPHAGTILDACAAPGGKSLVIAARMDAASALLSNELSGKRRRRLAAVLDKHLPAEIRSRVNVSGFDAAKAAGRQTERNRFAAIILDVPCSSERHVINNKTELEKWTPARPRFLAQRQWSLLSAAFLLLAPGGSLVYSTCSLNPEENDHVSARLLKKHPDTCAMDKPVFAEGEETEYGRIILPDISGGCGPMYIARFQKS